MKLYNVSVEKRCGFYWLDPSGPGIGAGSASITTCGLTPEEDAGNLAKLLQAAYEAGYTQSWHDNL